MRIADSWCNHVQSRGRDAAEPCSFQDLSLPCQVQTLFLIERTASSRCRGSPELAISLNLRGASASRSSSSLRGILPTWLTRIKKAHDDVKSNYHVWTQRSMPTPSRQQNGPSTEVEGRVEKTGSCHSPYREDIRGTKVETLFTSARTVVNSPFWEDESL